MKGFAALAMAAILVAQIAAFMFVGTASATHTVTVTPDRIKVKGGWEGVLTITVANATGSDAITMVQLSPPSGWSGFAPVRKVPKDNVVRCATNDLVILPAGTVVYLMENMNIFLPENTDVVVPKDKYILCPSIDTVQTTKLLADTLVEVRQGTYTENVENKAVTVPGGIDNAVDNFKVVYDTVFQLATNNRLKLLSDTSVVLVSGDTMRLPENIRAKVVASNENALESDNRITPFDNVTVTLKDNRVRAVNFIPGVNNSRNWNIAAGENLELTDNVVIILPGTEVQLAGPALVRIPENTEVIRLAGENVDVSTADVVENVPKGWSQDESTKTWTRIGDNKIAAGGSENFPFAIKAPTAAGTYTFYVRTKDTTGLQKDWPFQITVDNSVTVNVTVDKTWVGKNENITITVSSDEVFFFDNVLVRENNAPENTKIEMTTTDNKTYTGVYTTGENENRDGYLIIEVVNARDEIGNTPDTPVLKDKLVFVDRWAPDPPSLTGLVPVGIENKSDWSVTASLDATYDKLIWTPEGYSPENLLLEVLVDNTVAASGKASATGLVSFTITLTEGKHTIGARITDKAGNVGKENVENVYIDLSPPTITAVQPSKGATLGKKDVPENKLTISVKLRDAVLGIENVTGKEIADNFIENENFDAGYVVLLYKDGTLITGLTPKSYPKIENTENVVPNVFGITAEYTFENVLDLAPLLGPTGAKFNVVVYAGDNMGGHGKGPHRAMENIAFEVDISPPARPANISGSVTGGTTAFEPTKTKAPAVRLTGTAEPNATIQIWISVEGGAWSELTTARTTADAEGNWSTSVDLTANKGKSIGIKIRAVDKAGNEGEFQTYGYVLYDDSRPKVTIKSEYKQFTTDKNSVLIEGTVEKDSWETFDDITLTVSPATAAINFDRTTGKFTVSAPVSEGTNLITVEAVDPVGNRGSDTAVVTKTVTPWATYATILVVIALVLAAVAIFRKK